MKKRVIFLFPILLFAQNDLRIEILKIDNMILQTGQYLVKSKTTSKNNDRNGSNEFSELKKAEHLMSKIKKHSKNNNLKTARKKRITKPKNEKNKNNKKAILVNFKNKKNSSLSAISSKITKKSMPYFYNTNEQVTLNMILISGNDKKAIIDNQILTVGDYVKNCEIVNVNINGVVLKCKKNYQTIKVGERW